MFGAAKAVSDMADGGKKDRDAVKELRYELDQTSRKCNDLELQVQDSRVGFSNSNDVLLPYFLYELNFL